LPNAANQTVDRVIEAAFERAFDAVEGLDGSRLIDQAARRESEERDGRFVGMKEALTGYFVGVDAGFEDGDAHEVVACAEGGGFEWVEAGGRISGIAGN
jgi:hypothetical protein